MSVKSLIWKRLNVSVPVIVLLQSDGRNVAPSEIVYFNDSKADTPPFDDIFYLWKVAVKRRVIIVG